MPLVFDDEPTPTPSATSTVPSKKLVFDDEDKSIGGFVKNIGTDVTGTAKGLGSLVKTGSEIMNPWNIAMHPKETGQKALEVIKGVPKGIVEEGKRIGVGKLFTEGPVAAAKQFGSAFYEKPLTTAFDVAPAIGAAGKLMKGMRGAEAAKIAAPVAEVAPVVEQAATPGFRSAIKLRGKTYIGEPGDLHVDVIRQIAKEEGVPESVMYDTISKIGDQGFTQGGQYLTRAEASAAAGGVKGEAASLYGAGKMEGVAADDVARMAPEAPPPVNLPGEAAQILKEAPTTPPPPPSGAAGAAQAAEQAVPLGATFQETVSNLGKQIPQPIKKPLQDVQEFLAQKYGRVAEKPSWPRELGTILERKAQGMRLKEIGFSPMQLRKLYEKFGEQKVLDLADFAERKGITKEFLNHKMGQRIMELSEKSGQMIGGIREMAAQRGAVHNPQQLIQKIKSELDAKYLGKGGASSEKGAYLKALEDIKSGAKDPATLAQKLTEMNRRATTNKMIQPKGAVTDVANVASRINNELIKKVMKPAEWDAYQEALKEFGASEVFKRGYGFTFGREMAGRTGPGGPWNFIKDVGGRKLMEGVFDKVGKTIKNNPEIARNPSALTKEFLDDAAQTLDEIIEQVGGTGGQ